MKEQRKIGERERVRKNETETKGQREREREKEEKERETKRKGPERVSQRYENKEQETHIDTERKSEIEGVRDILADRSR